MSNTALLLALAVVSGVGVTMIVYGIVGDLAARRRRTTSPHVSVSEPEQPASNPSMATAPMLPTIARVSAVDRIGDEIVAQIEKSRRASRPVPMVMPRPQVPPQPQLPRSRAAKGSVPMPHVHAAYDDEAKTAVDHRSPFARSHRRTSS